MLIALSEEVSEGRVDPAVIAADLYSKLSEDPGWAKALELDLKADVLDRAAVLAHGQIVVTEINVGPQFDVRPLRDIEIPVHSVIVAIEHDDAILIARGDTVIGPGDRIVASSLIDDADELPVIFKAEGAEL